MATSTCVKCGNTRFELVEKNPAGSERPLAFIQCSQCGGVVGVLDTFDIGELILRLAGKLHVTLDS
jgi:hypothetical protein